MFFKTVWNNDLLHTFTACVTVCSRWSKTNGVLDYLMHWRQRLMFCRQDKSQPYLGPGHFMHAPHLTCRITTELHNPSCRSNCNSPTEKRAVIHTPFQLGNVSPLENLNPQTPTHFETIVTRRVAVIGMVVHCFLKGNVGRTINRTLSAACTLHLATHNLG